ncbi:MAG: VanW family protein [Chloroflexaceae bacterium]|nr:VanW family protein [Chloroflexaceae bacterium]
MRFSLRIVAAAALVALICLSLAPARTPQAHANPNDIFRYFPETGHMISGPVKTFFEAHGGLDNFGFPLTEVIIDRTTGFQVQYFERARFELRPDLPPEHYVTLSLAGEILTAGRTDPAFDWLVASPDPERDFFPESGHTIGGAFRYFWQTRGGLAVFGYPISEEFVEVNPEDGNEYIVQYFQRARFEYHPEMVGTPYDVQLGMLGRQLLQRDPIALAATAPVPEIALIGTATTGYAASIEERIHNIARATEMFNEIMVMPGEEFSFLSHADFSEDSGFVEGYAIIGGRLEKVTAGGLCQVSTTLFRAVSNAGLNITERHPHSFIVNFYENILGFDATVFDPGLDFKFVNDTSGPIYIFAESNVDAATVTFSIWGYNDGRSVSYDGPYTSNWIQPGPAIWEYDPNLAPGQVVHLVHGRAGVNVNYVRTITWPDGSAKSNTYYTYYRPWEDFYAYGPGVNTGE